MVHVERLAPEGAGDGATVLVLLHGRGSHERDLQDLGRALDPEAVVLTPRAPFPGAPWGYGPGWAWYRYLGGNRPEPESFEASLRAIDEVLEGLPEMAGLRPGKVVLGGFSQGGTMSIAYAISRPDRVDGVLNFSGFLADHPALEVGPGGATRVRVFWGHGTEDGNIPHGMAVSGRRDLQELGARVEPRDYPIGHWIAPEEVREAADWLKDF